VEVEIEVLPKLKSGQTFVFFFPAFKGWKLAVLLMFLLLFLSPERLKELLLLRRIFQVYFSLPLLFPLILFVGWPGGKQEPLHAKSFRLVIMLRGEQPSWL